VAGRVATRGGQQDESPAEGIMNCCQCVPDEPERESVCRDINRIPARTGASQRRACGASLRQRSCSKPAAGL
jgi:hypothetical protein